MHYTREGMRQAASWSLWIFQASFAILHLFPPLVYRTSAPVSTTYVVAHINHLGPVWILAFGLTALGLGLSLILRKGRHIWHLLSASVFVGYTSALFVGALGDSPHGPVTYPVLAMLPIVMHFILALSYGGDR